MDEKGLGKRLQAARQKAGLTQQGLCQKANLSYSTLAKIERGAIRSPSIFTISSIAAALGTTLDELIGASPLAAAGKVRQRSASGISFVYFDINGCLVRFLHRAFTKLAADTNRSIETVESVFLVHDEQTCRGDMSIGDFNANLASQLHVPALDWANYYLEAVEPIEQMHGLLDEIAQRYGVGLLTNIMPGLVDGLRARQLIPDVGYDAVVDSSEVHATKPEQAIYEVAMERANCPPGEILMVDDERVNLMAAEKLGWRVLWFDVYQPEETIAQIRTLLEPAEEPKPEPAPAEQPASGFYPPHQSQEQTWVNANN